MRALMSPLCDPQNESEYRLTYGKNKERKKNNSREKLFFETNQRILDAPGPASSKSINCMRPAKSQNSRSQSDDGTFWKTNIVKC